MDSSLEAEVAVSAEAVVIPVGKAREQYLANEGNYARLLTEVKYALEAEFLSRKMKIQSVTGRVKDLDSFLEKVDRKNYADPHGQAQDLVGVRVVALFISDLRLIEEVVGDLFEVVEKVDHVDGGPAEEFGYMSVHYVCRLGSGHAGARYKGIQDYVFEVQVRTVVMDAWANISHHLGYKGNSTIAADLRRDFYALSGLFYVADQHFELFFNRSKENEEHAEVAIGSEHAENLDIDLESMLALLRAVYPQRRRGERALASEFVNEVHAAGYVSIGQLERDLRETLDESESQERANPPVSPTESKTYLDVGIARLSLKRYNPNFKEMWDLKMAAYREGSSRSGSED